VQEGLYLDEQTRGLDAQLVTYNGELRVFGAARVSFDFLEAGSIRASYRWASWWRRRRPAAAAAATTALASC
jgi:hypothetical protein